MLNAFNFKIGFKEKCEASIHLKCVLNLYILSAFLCIPFAIITSKNNLYNSIAKFLVILKLQETIPPKALTGSHEREDLEIYKWLLLAETPQGLAGLTITVRLHCVNDLEIDSEGNMTL